ncbi:MAG: sensor histidine kinase [Thiolinea sp.]
MGQPLKKLDKKRLRRWLLLFFFALLIPTVLLVQQSYSRLKWETFHQHQLMAAELSERIDLRLMQLINNEDQRDFDDFAFLKTNADNKNNLPQRSPLAEFPVRTLPPGLLGHFQVDAAGQLITPIVPLNSSSNSHSIPATELNQRLALQNTIQDILAANKLVRKPPVRLQTPATETAINIGTNNSGDSVPTQINPAPADQLSEEAEPVIQAESAGAMSQLNSFTTANQEQAPDLAQSDDVIAEVFSRKNNTSHSNSAPVEAKESEAQADSPEQAPVTFKQLREISKQSAQQSDYDRVEDLQLKQNYLQKDAEKKRKTEAVSKQKQSASRIPKATSKPVKNRISPLRIRTFDNEIDPFEFSLLDKTYFVLFRQVWRNGQRYTQGLLIEQSTFLEEIINNAFARTTLSEMSDLLVAYQGNVLRAFSGQPEKNQRYQSQKITEQQLGEQLYQVRLSDPLSDLQLIYSITQLPVGAGGQLILWLSLLLGIVLLSGFYLMYRLGISQIELANQQQDFVSAVSHELKTPLTSIRMYGEMLIQGWAPEERKNTYYQFIFDESERLSRLINNVLQLARMTRNEQEAELAVHNVSDLVRDVKAKISSQIEAADFSLTVDMDEQSTSEQVMIDADWLTQIMINLVDNAIKFSAKAEVKTIILDVRSTAKQRVSFTINDHGPGIDKQQMKKIFQLFYRSENELTRDTVGTGIGLSLVHQMTTAMGGKVSVENRELNADFQGAAFSVTFPVI